MADENLVQEEGLMSSVPSEEPKAPDPSETSVPHKEEEKPQEVETKEDVVDSPPNPVELQAVEKKGLMAREGM